jgi:hypothetical protein
MLRRVVKLVLISNDRAEVRISKRELRAVLLDDQRSILSSPEHIQNQPKDDLLHLGIEATLKRCGLEIRLIVPPGTNGQTSAHSVSSLLKAVARAHDWYHRILNGKARDQRSLAKQTGLDEVYVGRILKCAYLAPDIVAAILEGRQPDSLTLGKLQKNLAMSWTEQRRQLGCPEA